MTRRPETGARALLALASKDGPARDGARAGLQALLLEHNGNATRAARALGLSASPALLALLEPLGLVEWLEETWPGRRAGGGSGKTNCDPLSAVERAL